MRFPVGKRKTDPQRETETLMGGMKRVKRVAAIVNEYRRHSHADLIVGKILEGYLHDGKEMPNLRVASMYVDQFPAGDKSRELAKKHNFPIFPRVEDTITLGKA